MWFDNIFTYYSTNTGVLSAQRRCDLKQNNSSKDKKEHECF